MRRASRSMATRRQELLRATRRQVDRKRIAALLRHSWRTRPNADRGCLRASDGRLRATIADENRSRGHMKFHAMPRAARRSPRMPESMIFAAGAVWRCSTSYAESGTKSSRKQTQSVRSRGCDGRIGKWQRKGLAVVPEGPLVAVIRTERIARLAHHDILR